MCARHEKKQYDEFGLGLEIPYSDPESYAPDLTTLSPQELDLAAKIVAIRRQKYGLYHSRYDSGDAI